MKKSEVYYMDLEADKLTKSLVVKMVTLFKKAKFDKVIEPNHYVAIKIRGAEWNNTAYLRPVYVRTIVDIVKQLGGIPYVVDTTTLPYHPFASRATAIEYIKTLERNGFSSATMGCPVVIADGFLGTDDVRVDLPEGIILQEQFVAIGIAEADMVIVLSHLNGHPMCAFTGAIENLGVGCVSKRGKYNIGMVGHPKYDLNKFQYYPERCKGIACPNSRVCDDICPEDAIHINYDGLIWEKEKCKGCLCHLPTMAECGVFADPNADEFYNAYTVAIADSALAVTKLIGSEKFCYLNFAIDITPDGDDLCYSDVPLSPDVGLFASHDPVAIDKASLDMIEKQVGKPGIFSSKGSFMGTTQNLQINAGDKIHLGSKSFNLTKIKQMSPYESMKFVINPVPIGYKLRRLYKKKKIIPEEGFKRKENVKDEIIKLL